ncbi:hypothetical protein TNIN_312281 [Trichonephila inaurata madagascariensis]|uniref:Uncharacterized protein n=1 Tax=Trichonephila inaurata madagascariensis TaxID=2747483 RepID=A0A8X6MEQ1_9ARAC|nr:hypothetical protein TNIN_312281 [Trichonephila inaurata madagascariensis]
MQEDISSSLQVHLQPNFFNGYACITRMYLFPAPIDPYIRESRLIFLTQTIPISNMGVIVGLLLSLALAVSTLAQMPPMPMQPPMPMPMQPPPPYNMYGPMNPYSGGSSGGMMYPPLPPQQMVPPPPGPSPYPAATSVSYSTAPLMPMMAAAAMPYPAYGAPSPMMIPPPYQTYSGSGPNGDPFTSSAG